VTETRHLPLLAAVAALLLPSCGAAPDGGDLSGWNVLLVTIDTLRGDRVGYAGYEGAQTPTIDGLADGGVSFDNAIAAAPVTLPAHASILTGRTPPAHGALDNAYYSLPGDVPTLATLLHDAGYATGAVIGAAVLHHQYGLDRGFDLYDDAMRQPRAGEPDEEQRRAAEVRERAEAWLSARPADRPFLLWVHLFDPHAPYDPPAAWRTRFAARPYDGEVAYADEQLGLLLAAIEAAGEAKHTLVVVVGDHGEAFGDGGEETHGLLLRASTLHVPMIVAAPGKLSGGRRVAGTVPTVDLLPTVLEWLGVPAPPGLDGTSLADAIRTGVAAGRTAYSETRYPLDTFGWAPLFGARDDGWARVRGPIPELYDLAADPHEAANVDGEHPDVEERLDGEVDRVLSGARDAAPREALREEDVEALRSLGYAYSSKAPEATGADPKERLAVMARFDDLRRTLDAGRNAEAADGLAELLREDPGNFEARTLYAEALIRSGLVDDGLVELGALVEAGRARGRTGTAIAKALQDADRPADAEKLLRALAENEPGDPAHGFNLGRLLARQGRWEEARAAYEGALRAAPDAEHVLAGAALAWASGARADAERALALIDRAIAQSDDDRALLTRAAILSRLGRTDDARALLRDLADRPRLRGITRDDVAAVMRRLP
jgi:choline-sulfatase